MDGDGDLDLVCGQSGQSVLFLNSRKCFATAPTGFAGQLEGTNGVALGDVDRDGDLDLVCAVTGQSALYPFEGGSFTSIPRWSSGTCNSYDAALGDVER